MRTEWGLLASEVGSSAGTVPADDNVLYVNTSVTLGVSNAGYWWSRLAAFALLLRVIYVLPGTDHPAYLLLFSDDGLKTGVGLAFHKTILLVFSILEIFSVPLSWKKAKGGLEVDWVGYWISIEAFKNGVSQKRQAWALEWCQKMASSEVVLVRSLREGFGRLTFPAGPVHQVRPFLVPMYVWTSACPLGAFVRMTSRCAGYSTSQLGCLEGLRGKEGCCWRGLPHRCKRRRQ